MIIVLITFQDFFEINLKVYRFPHFCQRLECSSCLWNFRHMSLLSEWCFSIKFVLITCICSKGHKLGKIHLMLNITKKQIRRPQNKPKKRIVRETTSENAAKQTVMGKKTDPVQNNKK